MTPIDALAAALARHVHPFSDVCIEPDQHETDAAAILAALPEGWRLTDEPEWTVERLAAALHNVYDDLSRIQAPYTENWENEWDRAMAAALIAAMRKVRE